MVRGLSHIYSRTSIKVIYYYIIIHKFLLCSKGKGFKTHFSPKKDIISDYRIFFYSFLGFIKILYASTSTPYPIQNDFFFLQNKEKTECSKRANFFATVSVETWKIVLIFKTSLNISCFYPLGCLRKFVLSGVISSSFVPIIKCCFSSLAHFNNDQS